MLATPLKHGITLDIPGEVDDQVSGADIICQKLWIIFFRDSIENIADSAIQSIFNSRTVIDEIHNRDIFRGHFDKLQNQRHSALRYRPTADYEQSPVKLHKKSPFN